MCDCKNKKKSDIDVSKTRFTNIVKTEPLEVHWGFSYDA